VSVGLIMATRSTNVESDESTMSQNAVVSCNRRLLALAIAGTRLNIYLRSEDSVRIVLRCELARNNDKTQRRNTEGN